MGTRRTRSGGWGPSSWIVSGSELAGSRPRTDQRDDHVRRMSRPSTWNPRQPASASPARTTVPPAGSTGAPCASCAYRRWRSRAAMASETGVLEPLKNADRLTIPRAYAPSSLRGEVYGRWCHTRSPPKWALRIPGHFRTARGDDTSDATLARTRAGRPTARGTGQLGPGVLPRRVRVPSRSSQRMAALLRHPRVRAVRTGAPVEPADGGTVRFAARSRTQPACTEDSKVDGRLSAAVTSRRAHRCRGPDPASSPTGHIQSTRDPTPTRFGRVPLRLGHGRPRQTGGAAALWHDLPALRPRRRTARRTHPTASTTCPHGQPLAPARMRTCVRTTTTLSTLEDLVRRRMPP